MSLPRQIEERDAPAWAPQMGRRIEEARRRRGVGKSELAREIGSHPNRVRDWERGERIPGLAQARELALALGVSLDWLAGIERCAVCGRTVEAAPGGAPHCVARGWTARDVADLDASLPDDVRDILWDAAWDDDAHEIGDDTPATLRALDAIERAAIALGVPPPWQRAGGVRIMPRKDFVAAARAAREIVMGRLVSMGRDAAREVR